MGRPKKYSLHFFPLDIGAFDDHKFVMIEESKGITGIYIAVRIMGFVYASEDGYFLRWEPGFEFSLAKKIGSGVTSANVNDIFSLCLSVGLFDKRMYEMHSIITSRGIQKRWRFIMEQMRRTVEINPDFLLIDTEDKPVSSEDTTIDSEKTGVDSGNSTQNEMKLKESKVNEKSNSAAAASPKKIVDTSLVEDPRKKNAAARPDDLQEVQNYFMDKLYNPTSPSGLFPDNIKREAAQFWNHYEANGWRQGKGTGRPIKKWKNAANNWIITMRKGTYNTAIGPSNTGPQIPEKRIDTSGRQQGVLPQIETDINFLYELFKEDQGLVTVETVEVSHYEYFKQKNMISFTEDQIGDIRKRAKELLEKKCITETQPALTTAMKKYALIDYFTALNSEGKEKIF